jgi:hypothetical protein
MERVNLQRAGGACAVFYGIGAAAFFALLVGVTGLAETDDAAAVLPMLAEHQASAATAAWLLAILPLLLAVSGVSFFHAQAGSLLWVALLAFVGGSFLIIYRGFVWLALTYELAPAYVDAGEAARTTLAIVGDTLERFAFGADLVGGVLIAGIGVPLFSIAVLRTALSSRWIAWLGFVVAVLGGWLTILGPVAEAFETLTFLGFAGFWVWMAAMGVAVWRAPETATDGPHPVRHQPRNAGGSS